MNVRSFSKRAIALLLSLVLLMGMLPVGAMATETEPTVAATTEVTEPSTETTAPSTEATEPSTEATAPSTEATEPSTEATEPSTEATEPSTEATEPKVIAVTGITLDQIALEVGVGELPMTLTATVLPEDATDKTVTWTSSEPGVVSVDEKGELTFGYMGEATITATAGDFTATCTVKVGEGEWSAYGNYDPDSTVLIAMSDYQNSDADSDEKKTVPQTIVNAMAEAGVIPSLALLGGDYTDGNVYYDGDDTSQYNLETELGNLTGILTTAWSGLPYYAIQGNHDYSGFVTDGTLTATGAKEYEHCNLYVINEDDFPWWQGGYGSYSDTTECKAAVEATAEKLETYLNGLISAGDTDPVIIMTHVPMHWTQRSTNSTSWWVDNIYANILFDVVNTAAEDLDILFLFGHNHSSGVSGGYDSEIGGALAYVAKGESMKIPNGTNGTSNYTTETLNFTYMNCGYVGNYIHTTDNCSISAIEVTNTAINIDRYTYSGSVVEKTITLEHNDPNAPKKVDHTDTSTGIVVNTWNTTTVSVQETTVDALADTTKYDLYKAYDITLSAALADGETATVKLPATGFTSKAKVYYVNGSELVDMNATIADGYATFTTDHFSVYAIAEPAAETGDWMGSEGGTTGSKEEKTIYKLVSTPAAGKEYLIVNANSAGSAYGVGSSTTGASVTVKAADDLSNVVYIDTIGSALEWTAATGWNFTSGSNSLGYSDGLSFSTESDWTYSDNQLTTSVSGSRWSTTYYLRYKNGWTTTTRSSQATSVYFYEKTTVTVDTTVTVPAAYYRLNGELTQTYDLSGGAVSVDTVLSGVKIQVASDSTGSTVTGTVDVTADMVSWSPAFDGKTAGTYTGTVTYNGYNLGNITVTTTGEYTAPDWITIPGTAAEGGYEKVESVSDLKAGEKYIVVVWRNFPSNPNQEGYVFHSANNRNFKVSTSDGYKTITSTAGTIGDNQKWYIVSTGNGTVTMQNVGNGKYLGSNIVAGSNSAVDLTIASGTNTYQNFAIGYGGKAIRFSNSSGQFSYGGGAPSSEVTGANACNITIYREVQASSGEDTYARLTGETNQTYVAGTTNLDTVLGKVKVEVTDSADAASGTEMAVTSDMVTWDTTFNPAVVGTYTGTVKYNGVELGTITVKITPKAVASIELVKVSGEVRVGSGSSTKTGGTIKVTYADGTSEIVDVTLGMLNTTGKTVGTFSGLTVTYGDKSVTGFDLTVYKAEGNDYPEYPNEGAVKVDKSATGIDFQETGVAKVELTTSGIPMNQGVDVVVVLDTSSSMQETVSGFNSNRLTILRPAVNSMIDQLQAKQADGSNPDLDIAIVAFNGFTGDGNSSDKYGPDDYIGDTAYATPNAGGWLTDKTGDGWVDVMDLSKTWATDNNGSNITTGSGTNYDEGLLMAYELLAAKKASWAAGETRKQYVIFMSDGAPFQYNGVYSNYTQSEWENWLLGNYINEDAIPNTVTNKSYYAGYAAGNGQDHRIAEAIKGDTNQNYTIVKTTADSNGSTYTESVPGMGATMYTIGYLLADNGQVTNETQDIVLKNMASSNDLYFDVDTVAELDTAFSQIATAVRMAAYNAYYVDQMGDDFNIQLTQTITRSDGTSIDIGVAPTIEVKTYDIYTLEEANASATDNITLDMVGDRKGSSQTLETVTFSTDGKQAFSNGGTTNILVNGVIYANTFWYNTNATAVMIDTNADGVTDYELPSETFYWKIGTVSTKELALSYYVYLEGALEGTKEAGSYPTNEYAILYYDNYLGNPCEKPTTSPVMSWKGATVSYAFYLVDENGNIIVNQTTGETGSFANKVAVTNPVVYKSVYLNNEGNVEAIKVTDVANTILPDGYELYDSSAEYTVHVYSGTGSNWEITKGTTVATTYVTGFGGTPDYSNELSEDGDYQYTDTTVWFAVLWKVQALPDTVVIDYGLPVDISVLTNDMFGENGKLTGVGAYSGSLNLDGYDATNALTATEHKGTYGTASINGDKIRYTPSNMQMDSYDKFAYSVNYTGTTNSGYYYDTVTVIPATTIYYEDSFVTLKSYTYNNGWTEVTDKEAENYVWSQEGNTIAGATQDEDRPGEYSLTDANNIYGYDSVNKAMSTYSMGSAMKASVDYDNYGSVEFTFYGTGFDVISMTSNTTGTIYVDVYDKDGKEVADKSFTVDTYYGYHQVSGDADGDGTIEDGELVWEVNPNAEDSIYQVPVIKVEGLTYGQYTAKITAMYDVNSDHVAPSNDTGSYDFYLDAIRIYDPANDGAADGSDDTTIEDAYKADGEGWPSYFELRNHIIAENELDTDDGLGDVTTDTKVTGLVFIDGDAEVGEAQIADYISYGPNNEVYLAPGQRVAFILDVPTNLANVHIGIKSADGNIGTYTITNIAKASNTEAGVTAGDYYAAKTATIDTTTDMYYDITGYKGDIIVISNTGDKYDTTGIISLTNVKFTYTSDPNDVSTASEDDGIALASEGSLYMTPAAATLTLRSLNTPAVEEVPEETVPETTVPEETVPETTAPEETEPEETVPETTVPEETEPEEDNMEEAIAETVKRIKKAIDWLKGWFGW